MILNWSDVSLLRGGKETSSERALGLREARFDALRDLETQTP
jgi:hypothetical protein